MKLSKQEAIYLIVLVLVTGFLRFYQLGYSTFSGDETKVLYWNKTIPAQQFLLNQRKGPVQFAAAWVMETATGGFNEAYIRLPFALASFLSVFILYAFLRKKYGLKQAFVGSFLFSTFGFNIAFGRTVQYQSFLVFFGLLALLFAEYEKDWLAGLSVGLAFLSHYDAVFYFLPVLYLFFKRYRLDFKKYLSLFIPLIACLALFFVPFIMGGFLQESELRGYLFRRLTGNELGKHSTLLNLFLYNPNIVWAVVFGFSVYGFIKSDEKWLYGLWFGVPFVLFEFVFSNPGTHVYNYFLPLLILSAFSTRNKKVIEYIFAGILAVTLVSNSLVYIPQFNKGYPWKNAVSVKANYQTFIYGFPYDRGWREVGEYLKAEGVRSFYTNDNVTIGEWYLLGVPANKNNPHYFISIIDNQEGKRHYLTNNLDYSRVSGIYDEARNYELVKEIFIDNHKTANVYKRID